VSELAEKVARLPKGAQKALLAMMPDWQFAGRSTFNANGAWSLHWSKGFGGRGVLAAYDLRKDGKWSRPAFRLTPLGEEAQAALRAIHSTSTSGTRLPLTTAPGQIDEA